MIEGNIQKVGYAQPLTLEPLQGLQSEIQKVIVGQHDTIEFILMALLCRGHVLLEGVPGIAKTTLIKTMAQALGLDFKRVQFTPDLLPADLIGTMIFNLKTQEFETKTGPIFCNVVLADEINRAPAKVQSALLEAMQEQQVTIGSQTHQLGDPFLVFATQNPLEQQGTYPLPEAQIDRFMFKLFMTYPNIEQERQIIEHACTPATVEKVLTAQQLLAAQKEVDAIYVDKRVIDYILTIVHATRNPDAWGVHDVAQHIQHGASPRATLALHKSAQARAFLHGRQFATPDDVKAVAVGVLRHRLILTFLAQSQQISSDEVIQKLLAQLATP